MSGTLSLPKLEHSKTKHIAFTICLLGACLEATAEPRNVDGSPETICGANDDLQYINNISAGLGVPFNLILEREGAVGAMSVDRSAGIGPKYCSGTLISANLFLTAAHCRPTLTKYPGSVIAMNFEFKAGMQELLPEDYYDIEAVVEDGSTLKSPIDYMILRLKGNPGNVYGITPMANYRLTKKAFITIIQHPAGYPKKVHGGSVETVRAKNFDYSNVDTLGGSSGAGVLDSRGYLVGVHVQGGCNTSGGGSNTAISTESITEVSPILKALLGVAPQ